MNEFKRVSAPRKKHTGTLPAPDLDLRLSMECGQIFGWEKDGLTYSGVIGGSAVSLRQSGDRVRYVSDRAIEPGCIASYLGLDENLAAIRSQIARDTFMRHVVESVRGLRVFKQDAWPCLCSYILSAQNRVERIDALVKEIASSVGKPHRIDGRVVYSLPGPRELAACGEVAIRSCGAGFRSPYLIEAAAMVARGDVDLEAVRELDEAEGREVLKELPGVGDKVADCVQLFAFSKYEAFPVDVWIKRVMERVYFHSCNVSPAEMRGFAQAYFGRWAGYAQEYMYTYARSHGLEW